MPFCVHTQMESKQNAIISYSPNKFIPPRGTPGTFPIANEMQYKTNRVAKTKNKNNKVETNFFNYP